MTIIAIDTGNKNIKTTRVPAFNAGLVEHDAEPPIKVDTLQYEGRYYTLTETRAAHQRDKTQNKTYFLLCLIAIAKHLMSLYPRLEVFDSDVCLALGAPPAHLPELREVYRRYFSNGGVPIEFTYNGASFRVTVKRVYVYPQGFAAITPYLAEISPKTRSYIIDIGGYTTDVVMLKKGGEPDLDFCESFDMGAIRLFAKARSRISARCHLDVDDYLIDAILRGEEHPGEEIESVAKEAASKYATELIRSLREKGVDMDLSYLIFIGGGALLMRDALLAEINRDDVFFVPNINANAVGYETLATAQYKHEEEQAAFNA